MYLYSVQVPQAVLLMGIFTRGHPCCILTGGRTFQAGKHPRTVQQQSRKTKQSTTNDSLLPTAGKEDSVPPCINDGRSPGWCWQGVNGRPRAFLSSHRLQPAGRSLLGALPWFSAPAVRGRHFCSIPRVLEIKRFLSLSPVKQQAVSPPPHHQTTDRAALRERCGFRSGLEFWCRGFCWSCAAEHHLWHGYAAQPPTQAGFASHGGDEPPAAWQRKKILLPSQRFPLGAVAPCISAFTTQHCLSQCNQKTLLLCSHFLRAQRGFVSLNTTVSLISVVFHFPKPTNTYYSILFV